MFECSFILYSSLIINRFLLLSFLSYLTCTALHILLITLHVNMDTWFRTGSCRKTRLSNDEGTSSSGTSSEIVDVSSLNIRKKTKIYFRKYNPDFLKIGFVFFDTEEEPMPQCVICFETLSNKCVKYSKLERHISTKHPECVANFLIFFKSRKKIFL